MLIGVLNSMRHVNEAPRRNYADITPEYFSRALARIRIASEDRNADDFTLPAQTLTGRRYELPWRPQTLLSVVSVQWVVSS